MQNDYRVLVDAMMEFGSPAGVRASMASLGLDGVLGAVIVLQVSFWIYKNFLQEAGK